MLVAVMALGVLAGASGLLLGFAAVRFRVEGDPIVEKIDAILPQTQCGQCGFAGCRPYAEAIAAGEADINQCPPGGENGIVALAELLGRDPRPLNPENGAEKAENGGGDRRAELHRLHAVHPGVSGGRHSRRGQAHAYGDR
jgi:electron transport complex protein RnfB